MNAPAVAVSADGKIIATDGTATIIAYEATHSGKTVSLAKDVK